MVFVLMVVAVGLLYVCKTRCPSCAFPFHNSMVLFLARPSWPEISMKLQEKVFYWQVKHIMTVSIVTCDMCVSNYTPLEHAFQLCIMVLLCIGTLWGNYYHAVPGAQIPMLLNQTLEPCCFIAQVTVRCLCFCIHSCPFGGHDVTPSQ